MPRRGCLPRCCSPARRWGKCPSAPTVLWSPAPWRCLPRLCVSNETMEEVQGICHWQLRSYLGEALLCGDRQVTVGALDTLWLDKIEFTGNVLCNVREAYFAYQLEVNGEMVSEGVSLFTAPKHFRFADPGLRLRREGDTLIVRAEHFAKSVEIRGGDGSGSYVRLSDNFLI